MLRRERRLRWSWRRCRIADRMVPTFIWGSGCPGEDGEADAVDVLLDGGRDDHFGGLTEAGVDDLHASVAEGSGDDLCAAVVAVEAGFGDEDADGGLIHSDVSIRGAMDVA